MTAPHPSRFSFAAFAMLLFALGATSTARAQTTSAPTQTLAAAQSQPQPPQKKVWTNDNVGGSHSQQNDASAPAQQNSNSTSTPRQNQKARKTRSGITIRSQSCRRRYRLSIKRLPNCRPRSMARRSTSLCTTAGIESATGKNNCSNFRRSARTRSTKSLPSRMKLGTTAFRPTRSLNPVACMSKKKPRGLIDARGFSQLTETGYVTRPQPVSFVRSSASRSAPGTYASLQSNQARASLATLRNALPALREPRETSDC
jgi:hypothetical protein